MARRPFWSVLLLCACVIAQPAKAQFGTEALGGVDVTPDGGAATVTKYSFGNSVSFSVHNGSTVTQTYQLFCHSSAAVTCVSVVPASVTLQAGGDTDVQVTFDATTGIKQCVALQANASDSGYYNLTIGSPVGVSVTPDLGPVQRTANASGYADVFTITNTSTSSKTYTLTHSSRGNVTTTGVTPSSLTLAAGDSGTATVTYSTGTIGSGKAILTATASGARDQGSTDVTIVNTGPGVALVVPTGATRAVVHNRQPILRATFLRASDALDTTATLLKWRGENVTALARQNRGLVEWEVDSTRWLAIGDSALAEVTACTVNGRCSTASRWIVLANDQAPVLGFTGMPLEALGAGFSAPFGTGLTVSGSEIEAGFSIPNYVSLGTPRSAGLVYSTRQSYPRALVPIDLELPWPAGTPDQIAIRLYDGPVKLDSAVIASPSCVTGAVKRCRTVLQADFASGSYSTPTRKWLTVEAAVTSGGVTRTGTDSVEVVVVDRRTTRYGSGWWPSGALQLVAAGADRVLVGPTGTATIYRGNGDSLYIPPPGNFTVLRKTATGWNLSPRGSLALLRFDAQGRLVASVDRNGNRDSVAYSGSTDQVTAFVDPVGKATSLTYGANGKLTTFTDPGGRQSRVTINGTSNQLTADSLSSPATRGDRTTFTYQTYPGTQTVVLRKRIGVVTDTTIVFYDSTFTRRPDRVRLALVTDEAGAAVTPAIKYIAHEQQGFRSLRSLDSVYVEMKDPRNNWTRSLLNRWAQPRKTWDAIGLLARTEYDPDGLVRWSEGKNGDSSRVYHDYDALRRLARTWITRGGNVLRLDSLVYDANHRVIKRIDARDKVDSLTYDSRGNLIETRDAAQNVTRTWYRSSDGLVDSTRAPGEGTSVRYSYEATWKNLYQVTDAAGTVLATNAYDGLGRVVTSDRKIRVEKSGTSYNWQWRRTETFYNSAGQVDSTRLLLALKCSTTCDPPTWPSNLTGLAQFQRVIRIFDRAGRDSLRINTNGTRVLTLYDRLGRAVIGQPWAGLSAEQDSMIYDVAGNVVKSITRRGDQITVTYDSRNRATSTVIPGVGALRKLFGGPQDQLTRMWYDTPTDSIGGINAELRWGYDSRGRLRADTSYTGTTARVTSYTYDAFERPGTMTDPLGTWTTQYEADRGYPNTLVTPFADTLTYTYDARSRAVGPTVRSSGPLHSRTPAWKATGELGSLVTTSGLTTAGSYDRSTYTLGEDGQVALGPSWTDGAGQVIDSLTYDGWERVRTWTQSRLGTIIANESYSFDRSGNILTGSESYDTVTDRLLSRTDAGQTRTYTYDQGGNLVSTVRAGVTTTYGYDALNRLVSLRQGSTLIARYAYDVLGRRIAKRVYSSSTGGTLAYTRFVYHGDQVAFESDSAGALGLRYTWGLGTDDLVGVRDAGGNQYYVVQDKLGSVRGLYRQDGTWWMRQSFAPYGGLVRRDTTTAGAGVPLRYAWTGREYDAETGWYYFRARYYDPQQRRFVQEDPVGHAGGMNLYAYVEGRALEATDPSGLYMMVNPPKEGGDGGGSAVGLAGIGDDLTDVFGYGAGYIARAQAQARIWAYHEDQRIRRLLAEVSVQAPTVLEASAGQYSPTTSSDDYSIFANANYNLGENLGPTRLLVRGYEPNLMSDAAVVQMNYRSGLLGLGVYHSSALSGTASGRIVLPNGEVQYNFTGTARGLSLYRRMTFMNVTGIVVHEGKGDYVAYLDYGYVVEY